MAVPLPGRPPGVALAPASGSAGPGRGPCTKPRPAA